MAPYKIALNVKESFEAKELLRQRHLPNGSVENLVSCDFVNYLFLVLNFTGCYWYI